MASEVKTGEKESSKSKVIATGTAIGGSVAFAAGSTAAIIGTTTTAATTITGAGAAIGGIVGGGIGAIAGSGIGIATGGTAIAGTIPLALAGSTTGASVGLAYATTVAGWFGISVVTAPVWAIPVAVAGGVATIGAGVYAIGRHCKWWGKKAADQEKAD